MNEHASFTEETKEKIFKEKRLFLSAVQALLENKIQRSFFPAEIPALAFLIERKWSEKFTPESFVSDNLKITDQTTPMDVLLSVRSHISSEADSLIRTMRESGNSRQRAMAEKEWQLGRDSENYATYTVGSLKNDYREAMKKERKTGHDESVAKRDLIAKATIGSVPGFLVPKWFLD